MCYLRNIQRSSPISLLQSVVGGFLLEFDLDVTVGQMLVCHFNSVHSFLQEVLFGLVQNYFGKWWSVKSHSCPETDYYSWQEELVKDTWVDGGKGSTVRSSLGFVLLDPSWLYDSIGEQKDSFFKFFLKFVNYFFIEWSE